MVSIEQAENLERVEEILTHAILAFAAFSPRKFHNADLLAYVRARIGQHIAPDSPGRILRLLRQKRMLNYRIVNRRQSLYEFTDLEPPAQRWGADLFDFH